MISSAIIPQPLARLPWRLLWLIFAICGAGLVTLYSAAGGSISPWALKQAVTILVFLGIAIGMSWIPESFIKQIIFPTYVLINPLQLAVMPGRLASGKLIQPRLLMGAPHKPAAAVAADPEHLAIIRNAMAAVVNGGGTAVASKLPLDGIQMAGKTGTAQVYRLTERGVANSNWALRDHALFIAFAPADKPRYSIGCIIEHGGFGASAAAPIVRDCMTYLFDQEKAWAALGPIEKNWGGTLAERTAARAAQYERISRATIAAKRA